jgi:hypothetical protein
MRDIWTAALLGILVSGVATGIGAQSKDPRFPSPKREQMTNAQRGVDNEIEASRGGVRGPFGPLLRSPELADRW